MVQPLAIVLNDRWVVGAQLEQKLEALDYRVEVSNDPDGLDTLAGRLKPLVVLVDLAKDSHLKSAAALLQRPDTRHVPILGYAPEVTSNLQTAADQAGISVVTDSAILQHLKQLLDQALRVD